MPAAIFLLFPLYKRSFLFYNGNTGSRRPDKGDFFMESRTIVHSAKRDSNVRLRAIAGYFASQHSHITHCIDMTQVKSEMRMAKAAARLFGESFSATPVDTILTMERTKMIGAFLAEELATAGVNINLDLAVITPETSHGQIIMRDNLLPYVQGKRVLLLTATATTGLTLSSALDGIRYFGGEPVGAATVFGGEFDFRDVPVVRLFDVKDIDGYASYPAMQCPLCKAGVKVDALINTYGYSKL